MQGLKVLIGATLLAFAAATPTPVLHQLGKRTESSPNPLGSVYPFNVTGTLNSTISVVPIPYDVARSVIPSQYRILKSAYYALLPGFPPDKYPLLVRAGLDHDLGLFGLDIHVPDFQKVQIVYPFVDLLGDGYSSFAYEKYLLLTADNLVAIAGVAGYGDIPVPSTFTPNGDAYAYAPGSHSEIIFNAFTVLNPVTPAVTTQFTPQPHLGPWPLEFYVNATNQPQFTDAILGCDNQINFFNTTLTTGSNVPIGIYGSVKIVAPYLPATCAFTHVHGIKVDIAFVENNQVSCASLKGYKHL